MRGGLLPALFALLALYVHYLNDFAPVGVYLPTGEANASVETHFSESYYAARALFRARVEAAHAKLYTLPLPHLAHLDLTIDVAVVKGSKERVLLHISGTHGVEGFAGSGIQSALLARLATEPEPSKEQEKKRPTVIFVHALNAYGFAQLRRFNEHNVDLNRNWLTPEEFAERQSRDPNQAGYVDVYDVLNPTDIQQIQDWFWVKGLWHLVTKGFDAIKKAVVNGNYHFPKSIFYGGSELEPSLVLLQSFLQEHVDFERVEKFGMVDVHTGLGPAGVDTLMLGKSNDMDLARNVFSGPEFQDRLAFTDDPENPVTRSYDGVGGFTYDGVTTMLGPRAKHNALLFCQEFGTVPGVFILKATVEENAMYQYQPPVRRLPFAQKIRDVFYLHQSASWKREVLRRGEEVYVRLHGFLAV